MRLGDGFHDVPAGKLAMVVTHLEMTTPLLRNASLPSGLEFAALDRDIDTYRDIFRRVGQDWLWFGRLVMDDADLSAIIKDPSVQVFTLLKGGQPEALLELDFRTRDECELAYFGLTSELIGTGAGGFLMDQAVRIAFERTITRLHVHTCTIDSPQALAFYQRSGFTATKRSVEIADDPRHLGLYDKNGTSPTPLL